MIFLASQESHCIVPRFRRVVGSPFTARIKAFTIAGVKASRLRGASASLPVRTSSIRTVEGGILGNSPIGPLNKGRGGAS